MQTNIDFIVIPTLDPTSLIIGDTSNWGVAENQPAYLTITLPGSNEGVNVSFVKHQLNILNTSNLGMSDVGEYLDLDDGIYEICLQSSYVDLLKKRYFLKDDVLRIEIDKLYIQAGINYNPDSPLQKDLQRIEFLLRSSEAFIKEGDTTRAMRGYNEAQRLVNNYKQCKDCI
jgi:hypothetical protein